MPIIHGFQSTNVWRAFILNALATSLAIVVALFIKMKFDRYIDIKGNRIREITNTSSIFLTFFAAFASTFSAFALLHFIFGFGGGMLIPNVE